MRKGLIVVGVIAGVGVLAAGGAMLWLKQQTQPMPSGDALYVRYQGKKSLSAVLQDLERRRVVRDASAAGWWAKFSRKPGLVAGGSYQVKPGMTLDEVVTVLQKPIQRMVRIPETNISVRTARLLANAQAASASEYLELIKNPADFEPVDAAPMPATLEGYLYPDTYDLPPLIGAHAVIERQLANFKKKVLPLVPDSAKRNEILTVASMVELEAAVDPDRPRIAGVIYNRLKKGMKLEIDACLLYGIGEWRTLTFADYRNIDSPYNTYKHKGLPPGPICSPTVKSVLGALHPQKHDFLYYVAMPNRHHLFAKTYAEHLRNCALVRKMKAAP